MPFVNVYSTNKAYGGPEEGGWYYSTGDAVKTIPVVTFDRARRALRLVERIVAAWNEDNPKPGSVLCRGYYVARIERDPAESYPSQRPLYE